MSENRFEIKCKVWLHPGMSGWHFVTLPKRQSANIKKTFGAMKRGWGSLPVAVMVDKTRWTTSIFPDKEVGAYLLPLKADIRKKENINSGQTLTFAIEIKL